MMNNNYVNQALILAAGRGSRLMPYTKDTPKPLVKINNKTLLEIQLNQLKNSEVKYVTIHTSYLGSKIKDYIGDGEKFGLKINYAHSEVLLGPGGGIIYSKEYINKPGEKFLLINGDVYTDFNFKKLLRAENQEFAIKLVLVDNPKHNLYGDFSLDSGLVVKKNFNSLTYSGISLINPNVFFEKTTELKSSFVELLEPFLDKKLVLGDYHDGVWDDVGTPERLNKILTFLK